MAHTFNTTIGTFEIRLTCGTHMRVCGDATIRGKTIPVSMDFFKWSDNQWHLGSEKENQFSQRNYNIYPYFPEMTEAFRNRLIDVVTPAILAWVSDPHAEEIIEKAGEDYRQEGIETRNKLIEAHYDFIVALEKEIDQLAQGENLPRHTQLKVD